MGGSCTFLAFFVLGPRLPSGAGGRTGGPPPTAAKGFTGLRQLCCATRSLSRSPRRRRTGSPLPGSHLTSSDSARIWGRCLRPPHPPGLASHGVHASMASLLRPPLRTFALKSSAPCPPSRSVFTLERKQKSPAEARPLFLKFSSGTAGKNVPGHQKTTSRRRRVSSKGR